MTHILGNVLAALVSTALSVLAAEYLARLVLDPVDYLNPTLVADKFLNHRIEGHTGGHDALGFRNARTPERAEIVCIGDSMTYGVAALASESWPSALGKMRSQTVYNMALGGYGPIQYLHLMRTEAGKLHPKIAIVGFTFQNDLLDVYNTVRLNPNWAAYGKLEGSETAAPAFIIPRREGRFLGTLRNWLSKHSVLYVLVTQSAAFDFMRQHEAVERMGSEPENLIAYRDDTHNTTFNLSPRDRFLDPGDSRIRSAMAITRHVLSDMRVSSETQSMRLIVILIPTKERVYADLLRRGGYTEKHSRLADALDQEDLVRARIVEFLRELNIEWVDVLPALEKEVRNRDLYPLTELHPNRDGYRVIAEAVNGYLNTPR